MPYQLAAKPAIIRLHLQHAGFTTRLAGETRDVRRIAPILRRAQNDQRTLVYETQTGMAVALRSLSPAARSSTSQPASSSEMMI